MAPDYKIKEKPEDFIVTEMTSIKPGKHGNYSYFLLKKTDYNTMSAIQRIANFLRIPLKDIGFAGTKDKKAITEQYISVKGGHEKRLENFKEEKMELKFLGKGENPISLGDLEGNEFEIIVRNAKEPKKLDKFINYFGEQRFGRNNREVGKEIVKGNLDKAVELIDDPAVKNFIKHNKNNYAGALKQLPKKILMLYIHSYQSYLWNEISKKYLNLSMPKGGSSGGGRRVGNILIPLIGFGTEFQNKKIKKIAEELMKKENITLRDFIIRKMPDLSSEGNERKMLTEVKNLKIKKIDETTYRLKFFLKKGCYATELIRQMF